MQYRYYQKDAINSIYDYFSIHSGNPLVAMPTGTGKSVVIAGFIQSALQRYPTTRVIKLTHVKELIEQNLDKLLKVWPTAPVGVYSAGIGRRDTHAPITFAGIGSVHKRAEVFGHVDLVIIDECHLLSDNNNSMYQRFLSDLRQQNPLVKVIGLTATPYRMKKGHLTDGKSLFTDVCFDNTQREQFNRLIAEGYLSPLVPKKPSVELDVENVHVRGGEFVSSELQEACDTDEITYAAVREIIEQGYNRQKWLIFATGIQHCNHIVSALDSFGVEAASIHSKLPNQQRRALLQAYDRGDIQCLVNNNILTTGFDQPNIDLIGVLRPTRSTGLWVQMLGRGTRIAESKKNCLVLDFAGNTRRLGPINDPVLPGPPGKKRQQGAPVRICDACDSYNHASARFCEFCGEEFPKSLNILKTASTDKLIADGMPQVEDFTVDRVTYARHIKQGRPDSIKVSYFCGLRLFKEFVCLEHEGFASKKARDWWRKHDPDFNYDDQDYAPPATTDQALSQVDKLRVPKSIRVWVNKEYPEVMNYDFEA